LLGYPLFSLPRISQRHSIGLSHQGKRICERIAGLSAVRLLSQSFQAITSRELEPKRVRCSRKVSILPAKPRGCDGWRAASMSSRDEPPKSLAAWHLCRPVVRIHGRTRTADPNALRLRRQWLDASESSPDPNARCCRLSPLPAPGRLPAKERSQHPLTRNRARPGVTIQAASGVVFGPNLRSTGHPLPILPQPPRTLHYKRSGSSRPEKIFSRQTESGIFDARFIRKAIRSRRGSSCRTAAEHQTLRSSCVAR